MSKSAVTIGIAIALLLAGLLHITHIGIIPTDTRIVQILDKNRETLLSIDGVIGAGIARDENNYIIGIAVYVKDNLTEIEKIPSKLGEFRVFVKGIGEASEFEKERMIIHR